MFRRHAAVLFVSSSLLALGGCGARAADLQGSVEASGPEGSAADGAGEASGAAAEPEEEEAPATDDGDWDDAGGSCFGPGDGGDCGNFLGCDDLPDEPLQCDVWAQDCSAGEKCTPIASTPDDPTFDMHACVPAGTRAPGESCTVAEGPVGTDTCMEGAKCLHVDGSTGQGTCVELCLGTPDAPACASPELECQRTEDGVLNLCVPPCHPLLPGACPSGQVCTPSFRGPDLKGFACFPAVTEALPGEPCAGANTCVAGHLCVEDQVYGPGCPSEFCCAEFCDVEDPEFACAGEGQQCVALFAPETVGLGNVGRCEIVP